MDIKTIGDNLELISISLAIIGGIIEGVIARIKGRKIAKSTANNVSETKDKVNRLYDFFGGKIFSEEVKRELNIVFNNGVRDVKSESMLIYLNRGKILIFNTIDDLMISDLFLFKDSTFNHKLFSLTLKSKLNTIVSDIELNKKDVSEQFFNELKESVDITSDKFINKVCLISSGKLNGTSKTQLKESLKDIITEMTMNSINIYNKNHND